MTGCQHVVRGGNSNFHLGCGIKYSQTICHDRLGRGCIVSEAKVHNRIEMTATNQSSSLDLRRPIVRLAFAHGE